MLDKLLKLLYESYDRDLKKEEMMALENGIDVYPELRSEKAALNTLRSRVSESAAQVSFAPGFSNRVMKQIFNLRQEPQPLISFVESLQSAFFKVALGTVFVLLALVFLNMFDNNMGKESSVVENPDPLESIYEQLSYSVLEGVL